MRLQRKTYLDVKRAEEQSRLADIRIINLGAGRQSTAMFLLALEGKIEPRPDIAIFADTGDEPGYVYDHLANLGSIAEKEDFPILIVSAGNIAQDVLEAESRGRFSSIPFHIFNEDGEPSLLKRQCTREYKIDPIEKGIRSYLGYKKGQWIRENVEQWIGISLDEVQRAKENRRVWSHNRFPLIELRITAEECVAICESALGYVPGKSSCRICPFHDHSYWMNLKENHPNDFEKAVAFDEKIRELKSLKIKSKAYLYQGMIPLKMIGEKEEPKAGDQLSFFDKGMLNECDGMCGV